MEYRRGTAADLAHLETFVWQAIFPAFDHPDLTEAQRAANDRVVEEAQAWAVRAMGREDEALYVAHDPTRGQLAGLIWAKAGDAPRIVLLVVGRRHWGQGVAAKLLEEAGFWLGEAKPLTARVRHYNERAIAFFEKQGFTATGETDMDFAIPRLVLQRPAGYQAQPDEDLDQLDLGFELPQAEPPPQNAAEELLDLTEPFARRNRAEPDQSEDQPKSRFPHIELEIETGEKAESLAESPAEESMADEAIGEEPPPFEFAFPSREVPHDPEPTNEEPIWEDLNFEELPDEILDLAGVDAAEPDTPNLPQEAADQLPEPATAFCTNCGAELPEGAKFCPQCGQAVVASGGKLREVQSTPPPIPQSATGEQAINRKATDRRKSDFKQYSPSEEEASSTSENTVNGPPPLPVTNDRTEIDQDNIDWDGSLISDFRAFFRERFQERVTDYFGERVVARYENHRRKSDFQDTVSTQLAALADWVRGRRELPAWRNAKGRTRLVAATEALIEFFLVEIASDLHGGIWPQRLLRHQARDWGDVDLFALVTDYLDFQAESDAVYTDFVRMPAKVLRNVSNRFLTATRDERVLFVCDQSLLGTGKDGYAMTDVAIYWRPVLQGAHRVLYQELTSIRMQGDHLRINGLFFDAGERTNLKMALLLRRLATLTNTYTYAA